MANKIDIEKVLTAAGLTVEEWLKKGEPEPKPAAKKAADKVEDTQV